MKISNLSLLPDSLVLALGFFTHDLMVTLRLQCICQVKGTRLQNP